MMYVGDAMGEVWPLRQKYFEVTNHTLSWGGDITTPIHPDEHNPLNSKLCHVYVVFALLYYLYMKMTVMTTKCLVLLLYFLGAYWVFKSSFSPLCSIS